MGNNERKKTTTKLTIDFSLVLQNLALNKFNIKRDKRTCSSAEARRKSQDKANEQKDKIKDFREFVEQMKKLYVNFNFVGDANESN